MAVPKTSAPSVEFILNTVLIDAIKAVDEDGMMQSVNLTVERIFGFKPEELIGIDREDKLCEDHPN